MNHEDNPPNVEPRHIDVIDRNNTLCMAARQARAKFAVSLFGKAVDDARKAALNCPYQVHFGLYQGQVEGFVQFADAVACLIDHLNDAGGAAWYAPKLLGLAHDDTSDGLSDEERDVVELARGE